MIGCEGVTDNGNDLVIGTFRASYLENKSGSSHGTIASVDVNKIIGIDPILPDTLKNIIGGGYGKLGGGAVATVSALKGYYSCHKEYLEQVLLRFRHSIGDIWNNICFMHFIEPAKRRVSGRGVCKWRERKRINLDECRCSRKDRWSNLDGGRLTNDNDSRWWVHLLGFDRDKRKWKRYRIGHISLLQRFYNIYRKTRCSTSDLVDWGCAI